MKTKEAYTNTMIKLTELEAKLDVLLKVFAEIRDEIAGTRQPKKYVNPVHDIKDIQKMWDEITSPGYIAGKIPCMYDTLTEEQRRQPIGLVCHCPKCTPYALSVGNLSDAGIPQEWRLTKYTDDAEE